MAKSKDVDVVAVLKKYPQCECQNDYHFLGGGHAYKKVTSTVVVLIGLSLIGMCKECAKKHTSGLQVQIIKE